MDALTSTLERLLPPVIPAIPTREDWQRMAAMEYRSRSQGASFARHDQEYLAGMNVLRALPAFKNEADEVICAFRREVRGKEIAALAKQLDAVKAGIADWKLPPEIVNELRALASNPGDGRRIIFIEESHGRASTQGCINDLREGERLRVALGKLNAEQAAEKPESEAKAEARKALLAQAAQERSRPKAAAVTS